MASGKWQEERGAKSEKRKRKRGVRSEEWLSARAEVIRALDLTSEHGVDVAIRWFPRLRWRELQMVAGLHEPLLADEEQVSIDSKPSSTWHIGSPHA